MKHLLSTVAAVFLLITAAVAQTTGTGQLTGTVVNATTRQPVEFATVALLAPAPATELESDSSQIYKEAD